MSTSRSPPTHGRLGTARLGTAGLGVAWQGSAGKAGKAGTGRARSGRARQGKARQTIDWALATAGSFHGSNDSAVSPRPGACTHSDQLP